MRKEDKGIWALSGVPTAPYKYYKFRITNGDDTNDVCDIYAKAASADSVASQITDINSDPAALPSFVRYGKKADYKNPFGDSGARAKAYTDAIIYEMHIRDWSRGEDPASTGTFLTVANGNAVIPHLQDLGITHVQLLPVFDYAETNADEKYNWGYNPYHFNVPEGRYVTKGYADGTQAVKEFRALVEKLHSAGIAVIMDVVYNHTAGNGKHSLYDMTVPSYYYNLTPDGALINGSGTGNEIASGAPMVQKYIIESLKHWMLDYHINGFRFDLMGCIEKDTMKLIYKELSAIDKNVMVYGESWTGGTSGVKNGITPPTKGSIDEMADATYSDNGVACFDDDFRDTVKGREFGGFQTGHVQGTFADAAIIKALTGSAEEVDVIGRFINYAECHDNYTLFDKLALSYLHKTKGRGDLFAQIGEAGLAEVKKQDTLAAAYILLAQGTPFLNGGQEFLRTKRGNENSYNSPDTDNQIDLRFKSAAKYADVYRTYKGLIALRKANTGAFGKNTAATARMIKPGLTQYRTGAFCVYFNATKEAKTIDATGYAKTVDVTSGAPKETPPSASVPAKSFVILKK